METTIGTPNISTTSMQVTERKPKHMQNRSKSMMNSDQYRGRNNYDDTGVDGLVIYIGVASPVALLFIIVWLLLKYEYRVDRITTFIKERTPNNRNQ